MKGEKAQAEMMRLEKSGIGDALERALLKKLWEMGSDTRLLSQLPEKVENRLEACWKAGEKNVEGESPVIEPNRQGEEAKREKESRSLGVEREWTG